MDVILSNLLSDLSCVLNVTTFLLLLYPSHIFINGVEDDLSNSYMSIFSFISILYVVSTANLKSSIGKRILHNPIGNVF